MKKNKSKQKSWEYKKWGTRRMEERKKDREEKEGYDTQVLI